MNFFETAGDIFSEEDEKSTGDDDMEENHTAESTLPDHAPRRRPSGQKPTSSDASKHSAEGRRIETQTTAAPPSATTTPESANLPNVREENDEMHHGPLLEPHGPVPHEPEARHSARDDVDGNPQHHVPGEGHEGGTGGIACKCQ